MAPASVNIENDAVPRENIESRFTNPERSGGKKVKYRVGEYVRVSKAKGVFAKGYEANYSEELFQISKTTRRQSLPIYELKDLAGD